MQASRSVLEPLTVRLYFRPERMQMGLSPTKAMKRE